MNMATINNPRAQDMKACMQAGKALSACFDSSQSSVLISFRKRFARHSNMFVGATNLIMMMALIQAMIMEKKIKLMQVQNLLLRLLLKWGRLSKRFANGKVSLTLN